MMGSPTTNSKVHDNKPQIYSLKSTTRLAYALPVISLYFLYGPLVILQGVYAKYFGVALTSIATVLLVSRLFDAITDPVIGYSSDRYNEKRGSRKPFIISGGLLMIVASWFLFVPFDFSAMRAATSVSDIYFLTWFLLFYLAYTLFEIPHLAWGSGLATDTREKDKVFAIRTLFVFLGGLLFYAIPLLPVFETSEFTPQTLKWSVMIAGFLMLPMLYLCNRQVPDAEVLPKIHLDYDTKSSQKLRQNLEATSLAIFYNKPLLILTTAHIFTGVSASMCFTLLFILADSYLELGAQFALIYVISFSAGMVSIRVWYQLAGILSKQVIWAVGMLITSIGFVGLGALSPYHTGWPALLFCLCLVYSGFATFGIMLPSLLSDISDYGAWKFGSDRAATYFSLYTFLNKAAGAVGGAVGLFVAGWSGFEPSASLHSESAILGLRFGVAWLPALIILLSVPFIIRIPISARRHAIIRRRLHARCNYRLEGD